MTRSLRVLLPLLVTLLAVPGVLDAAPADFWARWGDGRAELNGYRLTQPRYGQPRDGHAVLIFVTETFAASAQVKSDPGRRPPSDEFPVMKLNLMKNFRTGIYPYSLMTSAFARIEPANGFRAGDVTKLTFSAQEWCGHVFEEALFTPRGIDLSLHSYFDGEGTQKLELERPANGITADELPIRLREIIAPLAAPGASITVPFLPALTHARLLHRPLRWTEATLTRAAATTAITVPAGEMQAWRWEVKVKDGVSSTWWIEAAAPHRLLKWEGSDGERAELLGSARLKYWELNQPGGERFLKELGLAAP